MKKFRVVLLLALLSALATSVRALPTFQRYIEYFNSSGQQVGWRIWYCTGGTTGSGSMTDNYTVSAIWCSGSGDPISCEEDLGLESIPGCDICVSSGYLDLYNLNLAPNPCD